MKKFGLSLAINKLIVFLLCLFSFSFMVVNPVSLRVTPVQSCSYEKSYAIPKFKDVIKSLFGKEKTPVVENKNSTYVYLGGYPLGFTINCKGVVVIANSNPSAKDIKEGDVITKLDDIEVNSAEEIYKIINSQSYFGTQLKVTYVRKGEEFVTIIKPIYDFLQGIYKLGLWIRDDAAGVGTLTYIRKDNLRFGALGHPVCDIDTGSMLPVFTGNIFKCNIVGCKRGAKGNPGELKGLFLRNGSIYGSLDTNNKFGVYGTFSEKHVDKFSKDVVEVANRDEVKSGKAVIRCTVEGSEPKDYEIEIVKTYFQQTEDNKSMFIRVTDKELLSKTGGIIQGMSGSPIIQNGKLVGAVTHVFVSDPTKGYGVYADWMINN